MDWSAWEKFKLQDVPLVLTRLACQITRLALFIIVAWLAYSGIMYFLSMGNPEAYGRAKNNFFWSLIGMLVIFGVYTIIITIATAVGYSGLSLIPLKCS